MSWRTQDDRHFRVRARGPTISGMAAITVQGLHKRYGAVEAVRGVSFTVGAGEVLCLLGPNGAGKTTTVEIVEGFRRPDEGRVEVLGFDPARGERALRERTGIVLQSQGLQSALTVLETLEMHARWYERARDPGEVIELVELVDDSDTRVGSLSGGRRRRLDLALGLIGDPDVLFLDEPTTGFDPHARRQAWATIRSLCAEGRTAILTTHFMDEAQALADRVVVMVGGRNVAEGPPTELAGRDIAPARIRFQLPAGLTAADLPRLAHATATTDAAGVLVSTERPTAVTHALTGWALEHGLELPGLTVERPSLEDMYLALTEEVAA
jgi:ABC-2 type transport system ATP-binding protein